MQSRNPFLLLFIFLLCQLIGNSEIWILIETWLKKGSISSDFRPYFSKRNMAKEKPLILMFLVFFFSGR